MTRTGNRTPRALYNDDLMRTCVAFSYFTRLRIVNVRFDKHRIIVSCGHIHSTLLRVFHWHINIDFRFHKHRFLKNVSGVISIKYTMSEYVHYYYLHFTF